MGILLIIIYPKPYSIYLRGTIRVQGGSEQVPPEPTTWCRNRSSRNTSQIVCTCIMHPVVSSAGVRSENDFREVSYRIMKFQRILPSKQGPPKKQQKKKKTCYSKSPQLLTGPSYCSEEGQGALLHNKHKAAASKL